VSELDGLLDALADRVVARLEPQLQAIADELRDLRRQVSPGLFDVREAAARLGVSVVTVRRMVRRGELPSRKVGRSIRVDLDGVRALDANDVARLANDARGRRSVRLVRPEER
jgi:excisionase family DNA binding protein